MRTTHRYGGELVVFLIGMTINKPWRPDRWFPTLLAMPPMLRELSRAPDSGLLGYRMLLGLRGPTLVQYWDSLEKLYAYASDREALHRPAWAKFNRSAGRSSGAVGVWHETYVVDRAESIYVGTPRMGLARATERVEVGAGMHNARSRISRAA